MTQEENNEIPLLKRTYENYTHLSKIDNSIKRITSYRRSIMKFRCFLVLNILTLGLLHCISLCIPKLYLFLYCRPSEVSSCDYFLIEDTNGRLTLCPSNRKKLKVKKQTTREPFYSQSMMSNPVSTENTSINQVIMFYYNYSSYIYKEKTNLISPVYYDLSKALNKNICTVLSEGLTTQDHLDKNKSKYGDNKFKYSDFNIFEYFLYVEIPMFLFVITSGVIWIIFKNYVLGLFEIVLVIIITIIKLRRIFENRQSEKKNNHKYIVRRKFLKKEKNFTVEWENIYPGDVLLIQAGQILPCDGLLLEGECIVSEGEVTGSTEISGRTCFQKKMQLENNFNTFSYCKNRNSIIFQGMKIIECDSKLEDKSIVVLCINTGANTYTSNLYLGLGFEKHYEFNVLYHNRLSPFIFNFIIFIASVITLITTWKIKDIDYNKFPLYEYILKSIATSLTPTYHLTSSIVLFFSNQNLRHSKIQCINESRLSISSQITTVIFSKTGTLSETKLEFSNFIPLYIDNNKGLYFKMLNMDEIINLTREHLKFAIEADQIKKNKKSQSLPNILFLQCLVTCLEKVNNESLGNLLHQEILSSIKWELNHIKVTPPHWDKEESTIEVYPKNYYKITEKIGFLKKNNISKKSYKLQIIKTFDNTLSSLNASAIVFNTFDDVWRFNIKGPPEKVLVACLQSSIPNNIVELVSNYRKQGLRIIACATKVIDYKNYNHSKEEEYYLNGLTFVGLVTMKNPIKQEAKSVVEKLKKMSIEVIMATGDNSFTSIGVGFDTQIIKNKNIYQFELNEKDDIIITHLYKKEGNNDVENNYNNSNDNVSKSQIYNSQNSVNSTEKKQIIELALVDNSSNLLDQESKKSCDISNQEDSPSSNYISNQSFSNMSKADVFKYHPSRLAKMTHNSIFCISGPVFRKVYKNQRYYQLLIRYIKHRAKLFYSMNEDDKGLLVKLYKSFPNKTVCYFGNKPSDMNAILLSHLGIKSRDSFYISKFFTHFYSEVDNLSCVEKIIKNGRALCENQTLLFTFIIISTSIETLLNIYSYIYQTLSENINRVLLDFFIFALSTLAFRSKADKKVNFHSIFQTGLFMWYNTAKIIVMLALKIGVQLYFVIKFTPNKHLTQKQNNKVLLTFMYLLSVAEITSALYNFNRSHYFRKSHIANKLLFFFIMLITFLLCVEIFLSNRFSNSFVFQFLVFENSEFELDYHDDRNKVTLFVVIVIECVSTTLLIGVITWFFRIKGKILWERQRNVKYKKNK